MTCTPPATGSTLRIRQATLGDLRPAARLLAAAFHDGDLASWVMPDPSERHRRYPRYFEILVEDALQHGIVHLAHTSAAGPSAAVAVWYPGDGGDPADRILHYRARLDDAVGEAAPRFAALDTAMAATHARHTTGAHHYLAFLGVHPDRHGCGLGTALLRHHQHTLDTERLGAYLDATRHPNLYQRHGFTCLPAYHATGDSPPLYPMWRAPA